MLLAKLVSVVDIEGPVGWRIMVGVLLVPPALLKDRVDRLAHRPQLHGSAGMDNGRAQ